MVVSADNYYDARETRDPSMREAELFSRLPAILRKAMETPGYAEHLKGVDPARITTRTALATLPVLRKSDLPALHKADRTLRRLRRQATRRLCAALHLAGTDLRAGGRACRSLARRSRAVCSRLSPR